MKSIARVKRCGLAGFAVMTACLLCLSVSAVAQNTEAMRPRVIISTDIGGTDPDDNQSLAHLFFYTDEIDLEGIVSSPSYGKGSVDEIKRMISIYELDYPAMRKHSPRLMSPKALRRITKQGHRGLFGFKGYDKPTEGSKWIVDRARKQSSRPLWVLVWGSLEDVAQALHDAPDIVNRIRVYYIGGPNKKWGINSYAYIAQHFPSLWMIENNSSYRGFITDNKKNDCWNTGFYDYALKGRGHLAADFASYYKGVVKMGDTPSLLYMLDGTPEQPGEDCWGGSFVPVTRSPRRVFCRNLTLSDTVAVYSVVELRLKGPIPATAEDSASLCNQPAFTFIIDNQKWDGQYIGNGIYAVRYSPKAPAHLTYTIASDIKELDGQHGEMVVSGQWPGDASADDYYLGTNWFTDRPDAELFEGVWQGAKTIRKHRKEVLGDWAERMKWCE